LSDSLEFVEYEDILFLAYDGGRCKGVRFVGLFVISGGKTGTLELRGGDCGSFGDDG